MAKVQYVVLDETAAIIAARSEGERKRGEFVDRAVAHYNAFLCGQACEPEDLGLLERVAGRLGRLENKFDKLIALLDAEHQAAQ